MKCKKCKREIPDDALLCCYCASKQDNKSLYRRPDGLIEKKITIGGKRKYFRAKTEKELYRKIAEYNATIEEKPSSEMFSFYAGQLSDSWESLSPNSLRGYRPALKRCSEQFGNTPVDKITPYMIKAYIDSLSRTYAQKTVKTYRSIVAQVLELAVLNNDITSNPAMTKFKTKGRESVERQPASEHDIKEINAYWGESIFSRLAYLILYSGLRKGEALALQYKDIDTKSKVIHVSKSVYYFGNSPKLKSPKTKAGERSVYLMECLRDKFISSNPDNYIFSHDGKTLFRSHEVSAGWNEFCKKHDMAISCEDSSGKRYTKCTTTFHMLRHSYATMCYEKGIDKQIVQEMMGHTQYIVTEGYTHIDDKMITDSASKLDNGTEKAQ